MSLIGHCSLKKHKEVHVKLVIFSFFVADDASSNLHLSFKMSLKFMHFAVLETRTHNRFTALLNFVRDYPGKPAPER